LTDIKSRIGKGEYQRFSPRSDRRRADRKAAWPLSRKTERQKNERRIDHGCGNLQAGLRIVAGAQPRRATQSRHAFTATLVCASADHCGSTGDRGSEPAWTLESGRHVEGLFAGSETSRPIRWTGWRRVRQQAQKILDTFWTLWEVAPNPNTA